MRAVRFLSLAVVFGLSACGPKVATIELTPKAVTLSKKGDSQTVNAVAKDAEGKKVEGAQVVFTSSQPTVATVDAAGKVTAVKTGDATVVATVGDKTGDAKVKVSIPASISLAPTDLKLSAVGATSKVVAKVLDEKGGPVDAPVTFEIENAKIATVANGEVTAVSGGDTQLVATAAGLKATAKVSVVLPQVKSIEAEKELSIKVGAEPVKVKAMAKDPDGKEIPAVSLTYTSADAKIATVDANGMVTAVAKGKTKLTISNGEISATVEVKVAKK